MRLCTLLASTCVGGILLSLRRQRVRRRDSGKKWERERKRGEKEREIVEEKERERKRGEKEREILGEREREGVDGGDCCDVGSRVPSIWANVIDFENVLHVTSAIFNDYSVQNNFTGNFVFNFTGADAPDIDKYFNIFKIYNV